MVLMWPVRSMRQLSKQPTPLAGTIMAAAALCGLALAQTGLTTIQDTLFKADGTRFTGTLKIQWVTFDSTGIGTIVQQSKSVPVVKGNLQVQLAPNANAAAPADIYNVHYQSDGSQQFTETWTVPASAQALTVAAVRIVTLTGSTGSASNSTPIVESAVVGLVTDLGQRPTKGPGFGLGSVAVINQRSDRNSRRRRRRLRLCGRNSGALREPVALVLRCGNTGWPCGWNEYDIHIGEPSQRIEPDAFPEWFVYAGRAGLHSDRIGFAVYAGLSGASARRYSGSVI